MIEDQALVVILTYKRAERQATLRLLQRSGYTGPWVMLLSDDDPTIGEYLELYGEEHIHVFSKAEAVKITDRGDNFDAVNGVIFARYAVYQAAEELGYRYIFVLDDDYSQFSYRYIAKDHSYAKLNILSMDEVIEAMRQFCEDTGTLVTMSQGGEWMGGPHSGLGQAIWMKRKAMNSFMIDCQRPVWFPGFLNEDVNLYTQNQRNGQTICFTSSHISLEQADTQQVTGGMTERYLETGTYVKSMYSVMRTPSAVTCQPMPGGVTPRLHHRVDYDRCAPKIISEDLRKNK